MNKEADICAICAWRASCLKKFSLSGRDIRCPDFVRDASIKKEQQENKGKEDEKDEPREIEGCGLCH